AHGGGVRRGAERRNGKRRSVGSASDRATAASRRHCRLRGSGFVMPMRLARLVMLLCTIIAPATQDAVAQSYPSKAIKLLVGVPPGGPNDNMARIYADTLSAIVKQPVVIENVGGAGGTIGAAAAAKAQADGYTLLVGGAINLAIAPALITRLSYDPAKDFAP